MINTVERRFFVEPKETSQLARIVMRTGKILLSSGGDVVSVKNAMKHVCVSQPLATKPEAVISSNTLLFSFKAEHQIITRVSEVNKVSNDINKIALINQFVHNSHSMTMKEMEEELDRIEQEKPHSRAMRILASGICSAGFGFFFSDWADAIYIFFIGLGAGWILTSKINRVLAIMAAAFFVTICPILLQMIHIPIGIETTVVSNMPLMVPGMVIFNSIRDIINANYQAAAARFAEAILIAASIAAGTGIALAVVLL
ncbi:MAG TPA: hypothetical protein DCP49_04245 [Erysipelotrichaceae bacterium]|nr:hypothetical protein [Erysipelotrichaceae bacterium]